MTVVAIVGPTAAGKSALSVALAHRLGGEVVNADSMQLYRGMDIGTAKLTAAEQDGVPHHLLDVWDVTETASVAEYQRLARAAIDDILARGRVPLLVGGSGLYLRAVLEHFEFPGTDATLRRRRCRTRSGSGPGGASCSPVRCRARCRRRPGAGSIPGVRLRRTSARRRCRRCGRWARRASWSPATWWVTTAPARDWPTPADPRSRQCRPWTVPLSIASCSSFAPSSGVSWTECRSMLCSRRVRSRPVSWIAR
jgi:hypothetical protein